MLRIERPAGAMIVVSRLARPRVVAILTVVLAGLALAAARADLRVGAGLAISAALMAILGGRAVRTQFERGRVRVRQAIPFLPGAERRLAEFSGARVETVGEARRLRAERRAEQWRERSGLEMPSWMIRGDVPGTNDHLRRIVLVPRSGERLPVTAWLAEEDLERARGEIEALLR